MAWRLAKDNGKTMIYLNFDHMGVSSAQKLKMKHEKITYFRHYVNRTKIPDDMNLRKSNWDFFSMSILYFYKSKHNFLISSIKFLFQNGVYIGICKICTYLSANVKSFFLLILGSRLAGGSPEHVR